MSKRQLIIERCVPAICPNCKIVKDEFVDERYQICKLLGRLITVEDIQGTGEIPSFCPLAKVD